MSNIVKANNTTLSTEIVQKLVIDGDCSRMDENQKVQYMKYRCEQLGIDLAEKPFEFMKLNGKLVMYALKACTDALCRVRKLKREVMSREKVEDVYMVTARVTDESGRYDESIGVVSVGGLKGDALANAIMKAETKAKRRAVLSLCGLGMLDETELETIPKSAFEDKKPSKVVNVAWTALVPEEQRQTIDEQLGGDDIPDFSNTIEFPAYACKASEKLSILSGLELASLTSTDVAVINEEITRLQEMAKQDKSKAELELIRIKANNWAKTAFKEAA